MPGMPPCNVKKKSTTKVIDILSSFGIETVMVSKI